ncbi:tRNA wybutosine-synthesizing protein 2/3/4 [Babesia sp. Xinjiang]|uniref:tRNA wybutosine-synthesizing protein 2/3/4 n=1 Tax=Babesia sp. Xinjiang TaxID=462227 RepID=UPI000A22C50A|nr:tRNA wybutosine-synthesizing protein 2/3/4 [Babesia sp. Xinjiang]XP_028871460.1 tRNA wybutosine-synthesizing protein 2/3/4 [Babesia sp. Xinjiang]ORM40876.1 tRNA wybutosine-synthesizing protein 2/3/4 [Babesia sp. Xinjiang]ORM41004.1 tRNA wybutosine-synthesizing protein 2/3/4 [Babesia sp. Xinjiang]
MRADPKKVAQLLGDERLELIYLGTEHTLKDSTAYVRKQAQCADQGLKTRDDAAWQIYGNINLVLKSLQEQYEEPRNILIDRIRSNGPEFVTLSQQARDYINGRGTKELESDDTTGTTQLSYLDRSVKGSVDVLLIPLLRILLRTGRYASTSCCSGRTVLFECNADYATPATKHSNEFGRAGRFLYSSHCHVDQNDANEAVKTVDEHVSSKGMCYHKNDDTSQETRETNVLHVQPTNQCEVVLKFEPFLIHVECASMQDGAELLQIARGCGLKQSGIITCSKRVIVSLRGSNSLEAPVAMRHYGVDTLASNDTDRGADCDRVVEKEVHIKTTWLVDDSYFMYLLSTCNKKLTASIRQMLRLYWTIAQHFAIDITMPFAIPRLGNPWDNTDGACVGPSDATTSCQSQYDPNGCRNCSGHQKSPRSRHANNPNIYVAVKEYNYIKRIKNQLEKAKIYDKTRKIVTIPPFEPSGDNVDHGAEEYSQNSDYQGIPVEVTTDMLPTLNIAAFIPILYTTRYDLREELEDLPELLEQLVVTGGSITYLLDAAIISMILS